MNAVVQASFRLGEWIVHPDLNAIDGSGGRVRLEPRTMQLLLALAQSPGRTVRRVEILDRVWAGVDVGDEVLSRNVSLLRKAFGDDAQHPRYIATVPKIGYRLLQTAAPLPLSLDDVVPAEATATDAEVSARFARVRDRLPLAANDTTTYARGERGEPGDDAGDAAAEAPAAAAPAPATPHAAPASRRTRLLVPGLLAAAVAVALTWMATRQPPAAPREPVATRSVAAPPLAAVPEQGVLRATSAPGFEGEPSLSPGGGLLAYGARDEHDVPRIYVRAVGNGNARVLTSGDGRQYAPSFSPDGGHVAYIELSAEGCGVYRVALAGASRERLASCTLLSPATLDWSPDGQSLAYVTLDERGTPAIFEARVADRSTQRLVPAAADGAPDVAPRFAADGSALLFLRGDRTGRQVMRMERSSGAITRLTASRHDYHGYSIDPGSGWIVASVLRSGREALAWIDPVSGTLHHVGNGQGAQPNIDRSGRLLAYSRSEPRRQLFRAPLADGGRDDDKLLASSADDFHPALLADGSIVFASTRSGSPALWLARGGRDGELQRLTSFEADWVGLPVTAPDGHRVTFTVERDGGQRMWQIDLASYEAPVLREVASGDRDAFAGGYSPDGNTLYFGARDGGSWGLWRIGLEDGAQPQQVTPHGGRFVRVAPDGRVFFERPGRSGIHELGADGEPHVVLPAPSSERWASWRVTANGFVYFDTDPRDNSEKLCQADRAGNSTCRPFRGPRAVDFDLAADGSLYYTSTLPREGDVLVVPLRESPAGGWLAVPGR